MSDAFALVPVIDDTKTDDGPLPEAVAEDVAVVPGPVLVTERLSVPDVTLPESLLATWEPLEMASLTGAEVGPDAERPFAPSAPSSIPAAGVPTWAWPGWKGVAG